MNRVFETQKGTELPILNLKGKDYLEVKYRLVWFREEHPLWSVETEFVTVTDRMALAKAIIRDENSRVIATSHKQESAGHFPDFMEKAETGAIGRALALIGFGTQFCADELDEGERIVDAPAYPVNRNQPAYGQGSGAKFERKAPAAAEAHKVPPGRDFSNNEESGEPQVLNASSVGLTSSAVDLAEYRVNFGKKYYGKKLKEIPREDLVSYVKWLDESSAKQGKAPSYGVTLLKSAVDRYLYPEKYGNSPAAEGSSDASDEQDTAQEASQ